MESRLKDATFPEFTCVWTQFQSDAQWFAGLDELILMCLWTQRAAELGGLTLCGITTSVNLELLRQRGEGVYSSVVEHVHSMRKVLGSVPSASV